MTDICSDKTGTLTQGKMVAKKAWIPSKGTFAVGESNHPYDPTDGMLFFKTKQPRDIKTDEDESIEDAATYEKLLHQNPNLIEFLKVSTLANLAHVHQSDEGTWHARGDPTEIALQVFASRFQFNRTRFTSGDIPAWKQIAEYPFDSSIKKMSVIFEEHQTGKKYVFTKGAVERIIDSCTDIYLDDIEAVPVTSEIKDNIIANMEALASLGLRVLALASREFTGEIQEGDEQARSEAENGLTFRGLIGIWRSQSMARKAKLIVDLRHLRPSACRVRTFSQTVSGSRHRCAHAHGRPSWNSFCDCR